MLTFLDCTLRDGGYYNHWDFSEALIRQYFNAMKSAKVDVVEVGFRSLQNDVFNGACAYSTEDFIAGLITPEDDFQIGVMVNAAELLDGGLQYEVLDKLFPVEAPESVVGLVRIACHAHEFEAVLPAADWLAERGYQVGVNIMQIADRTVDEIAALAKAASHHPLAVLYFADSMGGMTPADVRRVIKSIRQHWAGPLGIHTHDNLGLALNNTLSALDDGVEWVDSTVTGMGRGPGNARTEELAIEIADRRNERVNLVPLMALVREVFSPLQNKYGWGTNPYYYLAGKYGIHPTYIQSMLNDPRYAEEDIFSAIEHLRVEGGKKYNPDTLDACRYFYSNALDGSFIPEEVMKNREVLILGAGHGVSAHRNAIESYIRKRHPIVLALNTHSDIEEDLIDYRVACHPMRLSADCEKHGILPQPLITPAGALPDDIKLVLGGKTLCDFGLEVREGVFEFHHNYCVLPNALVVGYALSVATSGRASCILMAGFDGYDADDPRHVEMQSMLSLYAGCADAVNLLSVTPTRYFIPTRSIYAL